MGRRSCPGPRSIARGQRGRRSMPTAAEDQPSTAHTLDASRHPLRVPATFHRSPIRLAPTRQDRRVERDHTALSPPQDPDLIEARLASHGSRPDRAFCTDVATHSEATAQAPTVGHRSGSSTEHRPRDVRWRRRAGDRGVAPWHRDAIPGQGAALGGPCPRVGDIRQGGSASHGCRHDQPAASRSVDLSEQGRRRSELTEPHPAEVGPGPDVSMATASSVGATPAGQRVGVRHPGGLHNAFRAASTGRNRACAQNARRDGSVTEAGWRSSSRTRPGWRTAVVRRRASRRACSPPCPR